MNENERDDALAQARASLESVRRAIVEMQAMEPERVTIETRSESAPGTREVRTPRKGVKGLLKRVRVPGPPWTLNLILYILAWISTTWVGTVWYGEGSVLSGLLFSGPLMTILTCHELGHYLQNRRYRIPASAPYFIPVPLPPLGTFGAVIVMRGRIPNSRALFDVGVSGPLAGLITTLIFLAIGLARSTVAPTSPELEAAGGFVFGEPVIMRLFAKWILGYDPEIHTLFMHPTAVAAWVGILLTTLNLFPIGQLDGGHVFYALTRKYAKKCSYALFALAVLSVLVFRLWNWSLFLVLLYFLGLRHPQSIDDAQKLDRGRTILGWATLAFIILGFCPKPLDYREPDPASDPPAASASADANESSAAL